MAQNIATAGGVMTGAGTATLPPMALVGSTANRIELIEISIVNTTAFACVLGLWRLTGAGTPGTALTPASHDPSDAAPTGTLRGLYSSTAPTLGADLGYRFSIPATIGAGVIRPFTPTGIIIPATTAAAIALMPVGTGQICQCDWTWCEL